MSQGSAPDHGDCWRLGYRALRTLLVNSHGATPSDVARLILLAGGELGAQDVRLYLIDYDQLILLPLVESGQPGPASIGVEGTVAGLAYQKMATQVGSAPDRPVAWVPVIDGTDRLGVLMLAFAAGHLVDACLLEQMSLFAALVAEFVITRNAYGDLLEITRRRVPMSLPAEIQWGLLPPLTFINGRVVISAVLSPAHAVAGDSFDYAVQTDRVHLAIFDAMGHELDAALMATVALAAVRNARRTGLDLPDVVRAVNSAVAAGFGADRFVTGVIGVLDLRTGGYRWVNAGHPPVLLVRHGRVVKRLDRSVNPPLGLMSGPPEIDEERLQAGDRLLMYTDGVTEARTPAGEFFGIDRLVELVTKHATAGRPAAETMRRLALAIVDHHSGVLDDDATTVLIEWLGPG